MAHTACGQCPLFRARWEQESPINNSHQGGSLGLHSAWIIFSSVSTSFSLFIGHNFLRCFVFYRLNFECTLCACGDLLSPAACFVVTCRQPCQQISPIMTSRMPMLAEARPSYRGFPYLEANRLAQTALLTRSKKADILIIYSVSAPCG